MAQTLLLARFDNPQGAYGSKDLDLPFALPPTQKLLGPGIGTATTTSAPGNND
jgi:hypothetical protein